MNSHWGQELQRINSEPQATGLGSGIAKDENCMNWPNDWNQELH